MAIQNKKYRYLATAFLGTLLVIYVNLQIVMPIARNSYELDFNNSCSTGAITFFDIQGSTCSNARYGSIGFPFVIDGGPFYEDVLSAVIDILPLVALIALMRSIYPSKQL